MKSKILNLCLFVTSLFGYLEWGGDNQMFLWKGEMEILAKLSNDPLLVLHPFTVLPLVGQMILLITLFQKKPSRLLTYLGMGGIGILMLLIFGIGLMGANFKIAGSAIPFLITGILVIRNNLATV